MTNLLMAELPQPTHAFDSKSTASSQKAAPAAEPSSSPFGLFGSAPANSLSRFQGDEGTCSEADALKKQPSLIHTSELREGLTGGKAEAAFCSRAAGQRIRRGSYSRSA